MSNAANVHLYVAVELGGTSRPAVIHVIRPATLKASDIPSLPCTAAGSLGSRDFAPLVPGGRLSDAPLIPRVAPLATPEAASNADLATLALREAILDGAGADADEVARTAVANVRDREGAIRHLLARAAEHLGDGSVATHPVLRTLRGVVFHVTLPAVPAVDGPGKAPVNRAAWLKAAATFRRAKWHEFAPALTVALWSGVDARQEWAGSGSDGEWVPDVCGESDCPVGAHNAWCGHEAVVRWQDGAPACVWEEWTCDADGNWDAGGEDIPANDRAGFARHAADCAHARLNYWAHVLDTGAEPCGELLRPQGAEDLHARAWKAYQDELATLRRTAYGRKLARCAWKRCPPLPKKGG